MTPRRWSVCALVLVLLLTAGCYEPNRVEGGSQYNWYSIDEDIELGEGVMAGALTEGRKWASQGIIIDEPDFHGYIQGIVSDIARVSHYPEFPWEVHVMNADTVNAWCAPGGKIMVYAGLFVESGKGFVTYNDRDEVAAVLGHEIAHATCRHVTNRLSSTKTVLLCVFPVYLAALLFVPELSSIWELTFQGGVAVWAADYSRDHEAQADIVGAEYAARAGYDPRGAIRIWERAHQKFGSDFDLLGSHPPSDERAEALREEMPRLVQIYEQVNSGFPAEPYPPHPDEVPEAEE